MMMQALINGRWPLLLPEHRARFHAERPWWEAARLSDMYAYIKPGMNLIDVGSEEGDLTALYASWGASVHFVDPSAPWIAQTIETLYANDLRIGEHFTGFAGNIPREGGVHPDRGFAQLDESTQVAVIRLDRWMAEGCDAITMDVEGSEYAVLDGSRGILPPLVWVSIHGDVDPHAPMPSEVHKLMRSEGYQDQFLAYDHEWHYRFFR